jgi:hypothetical protein
MNSGSSSVAPTNATGRDNPGAQASVSVAIVCEAGADFFVIALGFGLVAVARATGLDDCHPIATRLASIAGGRLKM